MKELLIFIYIFFTFNLFSNTNYNVYVKFDKNTENIVSDISKNLEKVGIKSLYSDGYLIHLTLYLTEYKKEALNDIIKEIDLIAKETSPFEIDFYQIRKTGGNWLMLDAIKSDKLSTLSNLIANKLIPLRALDAKVPNWAVSIPEKSEAFKKFGSPNVYENFDPHITLLTPQDPEKLQKFLDNYKLNKFKAKITGIGIAQVNDLGQAKHEIYFIKF
ncbi:2'-5' RNA ligase family protein [Caviibacter abscessus]|uniref:2'-5' RNA ligase family protein n=1 Tax=Caviibacter abscessus TaxID=1766719 RepID=UPI00082CF8FC|nr:2'-5' RNA ligase family protein [Caviibacter abscessus]